MALTGIDPESNPRGDVLMKGRLRNCQIDFDADALRHNLQRVRDFAPGCHIMPVVKANAYGHGLAAVYQVLDEALADTDSFAVAMLAEAVALRELGCQRPIIVFHGFSSADDLAIIEAHDLQATVHSMQQLELLDAYTGAPLCVWLKVDTGMHRLGIDMAQVADCYAHLESCRGVQQVHVLSHFANADDAGNIINNNQLINILKVKNDIVVRPQSQFSMANSAAVVSLAESHFDCVRPGIMLYGASPVLQQSATELGLKPVMRFRSHVLDIKQCNAGDAIGYGSSWQCPQDMSVAIVPVGYADGYPRHAPAGTPVWVNGQETQLIGRVSMDSLYIDCRGLRVFPGDEVELWGSHIAVDRVAQSAGTISYELLCHVGNSGAGQT